VTIQRQPEWPTISVSVRYYAGARAAAGVAEERLTLASPRATPATVGTLVEELAARHGAELARVLAASSIIVDEVGAGREQTLDDGAQVDVLPPFAGG
jgi:molybdopterin converting factor small subunit